MVGAELTYSVNNLFFMLLKQLFILLSQKRSCVYMYVEKAFLLFLYTVHDSVISLPFSATECCQLNAGSH